MAEHEDMSPANDRNGLVDKGINRRLTALDVDTVDQFTRECLRKIHTVLESEVAARKEAEAEVRRHNLSVQSVSRLSGISHATFYKRPLLARYVKAFRAAEKDRSGTGEKESLRLRLEAALAENALMRESGALMVQQQHEIERLKAELRRREIQERGGLPASDGMGEVIPLDSGCRD